MLKFLLMTAVIAVGSLPAYAQSASESASCSLVHATGVHEQQLMSGQRQRSFRLFVPPAYEGRTPLALVLDMHGSGGTAAGQARTSGFEGVAAREGFAVASLQADGGRWNFPVDANRASDVTYVADVIDHVASRVCIDRSRVFATGFSGGGRMSSLLACHLSERIAAIAPVAGLRWPAPCEGRPIPVLTFHGLADRQNPYAGNVQGRNGEWVESVPDALAGWAQHNGCNPRLIEEDPDGPMSTMRYAGCRAGTEVRLLRIDGLGHAWPKQEIDTTSTIWEFFKSQRLPQ